MQLLMNVKDNKVFLVLFSPHPSTDLCLYRKSAINCLIKNMCAPMRYLFKNQGNDGIVIPKFPCNRIGNHSVDSGIKALIVAIFSLVYLTFYRLK